MNDLGRVRVSLLCAMLGAGNSPNWRRGSDHSDNQSWVAHPEPRSQHAAVAAAVVRGISFENGGRRGDLPPNPTTALL